MEQGQKRQVALKLRVADILNGNYVKEEGWNPNYILTKDGRKAARANMLGTVVTMPVVEVSYRSVMLDDGSGKISIRSFEESDVFKGISIGDIVFVIGRPRQYGSEIYIMPEIIKKVQNKAWIDVRKIELENEIKTDINAAGNGKMQNNAAVKDAENQADAIADVGEAVTVTAETGKKPNTESTQQKIYSIIKALDKGDGANFEDVLEKSGMADADKIISRLLMEGEIFELGKGKLKVLE